MKKVVVLYDATPCSQVNEGVSAALDVLSDARDIAGILGRQGYETRLLGLRPPLMHGIQELSDAKPDLVFNLCEGLGEESRYEIHVASLVELLGCVFTGAGSLGLALCHDKALAKGFLSSHGIPTPKHILIEQGDSIRKNGLEFPLMAKPACEDGSLGIDKDSVVTSLAALKTKVAAIHRRFRESALVEEFIDGREFNVSMLGNDPFDCLEIREILFHPSYQPRIVSFEAKWEKASFAYRSTVGSAARDLAPHLREDILQYARQCFKIFKLRDYARIDFRLGESGLAHVIDVNPNPCISRDSGMALAARQKGFSYEELIGRIVRLATARSCSGEGASSRII